MITKYEIKQKLLPSSVNASSKVGPFEALVLFQDMATVGSLLTGTDYYNLKEKSNAFWIITRTRLHFSREPKMFEDVTLSTWPNAPSSIAANRNYVMYGKDGEPAITGVSEWAIIDVDTRRLRRINSTCYPINEEHPTETLFDAPFHRLTGDFGEEDYVYSHIVRASDTDMSRHTNNAIYCRFMLDALPKSFFTENTVTDFEVRYAMESKEGDELSIYKKEDGKVIHLAVKNAEGKTIVTAMLTIA